MAKKIEDYLHLYPKVSIAICEPNIEPVGHYLEGIDWHLDKAIAERVDYPFEWIKPILRPLSDLKDEEAAAIFQIHRNNDEGLGGHDFYVQKQDHGFIVTRLDLMELHLMISDASGEIYMVADVPKQRIEPVRNVFLITKFLLSKHFDLFNLIKEGLAIQQTKP
jgi:hypothetical protein